MFFLDFRVNNYIIQINNNKNIKFFDENFIDQVLKQCKSINEVKK